MAWGYRVGTKHRIWKKISWYNRREGIRVESVILINLYKGRENVLYKYNKYKEITNSSREEITVEK